MKTILIITTLLSFNISQVDSTDSTSIKSAISIAAQAEPITEDDIENEGLFYLLTAPVYAGIIIVGAAIFIFLANAL